MQSKIDKEAYKRLLEKHDWYFEMSDDWKVYHKGFEERLQLIELAGSDKELNEMFDEAYNQNTFNGEQHWKLKRSDNL